MRQILHAVKGWIRGNSPKGAKTAIVYVFAPGKDAPGGDLGGQDQILILRRLSTFVSRENIPVTIIFPGRPTRKIPEGASQGGVQVHYATSDQLKKVVASAVAAARKGHSVVLATNHPELEKSARSERLRHIRATTFEKALDSICGPLRREQQQRRQPQAPQSAPPPRPAPATEPTPPAEPGPARDEAPQAHDEQAHDQTAPTPAPRSAQPPLQRHRRGDAPIKKEERDQSILDLIDPL